MSFEVRMKKRKKMIVLRIFSALMIAAIVYNLWWIVGVFNLNRRIMTQIK